MNVTQNLPNKIFRNIFQCTDLVFSEYTCPVIPRTQALLEGHGWRPAPSVPLGTGVQQWGKCLGTLTHPEIWITEADTGLKVWFTCTCKSLLKLRLLLCQIAPKVFKICDPISAGPFTLGNKYYPVCHRPQLVCDWMPALLRTDQQRVFLLCSFALAVAQTRFSPPC